MLLDFHTIIECSFLEKKESLVIRFLDGTCLKIPVNNIPVRYRMKVADWNTFLVNEDKKGITLAAKKGRAITIPSHVFYASGKKF